jgi:hypothetical protein
MTWVAKNLPTRSGTSQRKQRLASPQWQKFATRPSQKDANETNGGGGDGGQNYPPAFDGGRDLVRTGEARPE